MTVALRATLATPATWPLALATFLLRGGIVIVALPILVLPTPVGLADVFAPTVTALAFGSISPEVFIVGGAAVVGLLAWLVGAGWLAAAIEAEGALVVALDQEVHPPPVGQSAGHVAGRILAARLFALVPVAIALSLGSVRIVFATYRELTSPLDVSTPLVMRVLRDSPEVVVAVLLTWLVGEVVGAIAARRIALAGDGVVRALHVAVDTCLRHPVSTLLRFVLPDVVLLLLLASCFAAVGSAWSAVSTVLDGTSDGRWSVAIVALLVVLWLVGLLLTAVVCAWRAAVWTVAEVERERTFGGSTDRRPGDWQPDGTSATL
jgi:hypothetical protein